MLYLWWIVFLPAMASAVWNRNGGKESNNVREQLHQMWQASNSGLSFADWLRQSVHATPAQGYRA
jgi:hypothetical protein